MPMSRITGRNEKRKLAFTSHTSLTMSWNRVQEVESLDHNEPTAITEESRTSERHLPLTNHQSLSQSQYDY